jgi:hypothetical protein
MSRSALHRLLLAPAVLTALLAAAPVALADDPVATTTSGTAAITADARVAAWRADSGRLTVAFAGRAPVTTSFRPPAGAILDVGPRTGGGAQLIYASGCSTHTDRCALRTVALTTAAVAGTLHPRTVARIPYRGGGGAPAVAIDGARIAYAVHGSTGSGKARRACDVPYVRFTSRGRSSTRKLDRGHCAAIAQLDLGLGHVAILAKPTARATEVRTVLTGGGHSRTLQSENQGEESNYVGAVSIDRGGLYASLGGLRPTNAFLRFSLKNYKKTTARSFVALVGPFARDRDHQYYVEQPAGPSYDCRGAAGLAPCLVVSGDDPFSGAPRTLPTELALTVAPQPAFTDTPPSATVTAVRRRVTQSAQVGTDPVAGLPVQLLSARLTAAEPGPLTPTAATGTTGADGTATIAVPSTPVPRMSLGAASRPGAGAIGVQTPDAFLLQTFVRMTGVPERLPDGRLRITGTISPAQPGRKVKLERRIQRVCEHVVSGGLITPSTVDTPAGCIDRWSQDPLATADVSADGASYAIEAATPADVYRVSLDFAGGADVFPGETAQITAP